MFNFSDPVVISSNPSWRRTDNNLASTDNTDMAGISNDGTEVGVSILHMLYTATESNASRVSTPARLSFLGENHALVRYLIINNK